MKSFFTKILLTLAIIFCSPIVASGQCAMCRAALLTSGKEGLAQGINHGIAYLMVIPYLTVGILGYAVYRIAKKESPSH